MSFQNGIRFRSMMEFWDHLPENERIIVDVLRQIILEVLPRTCKEKLTYNVPFYYGKKRICLIWPASVPWGGFKTGVLLGFCQGNKLMDPANYLTHGTNKKVFYKIFNSGDEIEQNRIIALLNEAVKIDGLTK
ncbi:MAG: DUF1801 domain-containing protein [Chitinophagaceae bacterium]